MEYLAHSICPDDRMECIATPCHQPCNPFSAVFRRKCLQGKLRIRCIAARYEVRDRR
jgi:hypothetical protein